MRPAISRVTVSNASGKKQARIEGPLGAEQGDGPGYFWVRVALDEEPTEDGPEAVGADEMTAAEFAAAAEGGGGMWSATVPVKRGAFDEGNVFVAAWALVHTQTGQRTFWSYWYDESVPLTVKEATTQD
jgi:hypothetical protein